jgi:hypothetical protein
MAHLSKESRLLALGQLLDYARKESKDLGLAHLDKLLGAAVLAVSDKARQGENPVAQDGRIAQSASVKAMITSSSTRLSTDDADTASSPCSKERLR